MTPPGTRCFSWVKCWDGTVPGGLISGGCIERRFRGFLIWWWIAVTRDGWLIAGGGCLFAGGIRTRRWSIACGIGPVRLLSGYLCSCFRATRWIDVDDASVFVFVTLIPPSILRLLVIGNPDSSCRLFAQKKLFITAHLPRDHHILPNGRHCHFRILFSLALPTAQ